MKSFTLIEKHFSWADVFIFLVSVGCFYFGISFAIHKILVPSDAKVLYYAWDGLLLLTSFGLPLVYIILWKMKRMVIATEGIFICPLLLGVTQNFFQTVLTRDRIERVELVHKWVRGEFVGTVAIKTADRTYLYSTDEKEFWDQIQLELKSLSYQYTCDQKNS